MAENVQCPVCTLFLHAGMSLSDHLETHPKEQVIKALVQMTMTGGGSSASALKAALLGGDAKHGEKQEHHNKGTEKATEMNKTENDVSRSNSRMSTISNASATISSTASSTASRGLNFTNSLAASESAQPRGESTATLDNACADDELNRKSNAKQSYQTSRSNLAENETTAISEAFNAMHFSRFQQQQQQPEQKQQHQQQPQQPPPPPQNQSQLKIVHQKHQTTTPFKQSNFGNMIAQQQQLPPPPPTMHVQQQQSKLQSTPLEITTSAFPTHLYAASAANQRQQLHHHQQQSPKIIFSGGANLPPPPPLQLFSYQHSTQPHQHQKPPPAYGAAISQIRSQQNQKQNFVQGTPAFPQKAQAFTQHQQQLTPINSPRIVSHVASLQLGATMTASTSSSTATSAQTSACPKVGELSQATVEKTRSNEALQKLQPPPPPPLTQASAPTQKSSNTGANYTPIITATSRQTSSPFSSLIAVQSPSSVLRFAESPVAHYLERDNGDFIVQETPKHIVECVEEEDGEFSVIERFHQSPPSVLHIHDDDDDDDMHNDDNVSIVSSRSENSMKKEMSAKHKNKSQRSEKQATNKEDRGSSSSNSSFYAKTKGNNTIESGNSSGINSTTGSNSNTLDGAIKKTSKNTITVLSDVQLNLNEYLNLMGNIIASGKMTKRRTACSASAPIPLVKVEKIEPEDNEDYEMTNAGWNEPSNDELTFNKDNKTPAPMSLASQQKANTNETERRQQSAAATVLLDEAPSCSKNCSINTTKWKECDDVKPSISAESNMKNLALPAPPIHLTSVIRMASAATTKTFTQQRASTPPLKLSNQESARNAKETSDETSHQAKQQQHDLTNAVADANMKPSFSLSSSSISPAPIESTQTPQDLSQPQKNVSALPKDDGDDKCTPNNAFGQGLPPPPPLRKGPKKLVIKPKSIKTEDIAKKPERVDKSPTISQAPTEAPTTSKTRENTAPTTANNTNAELTQTVPDVVIKCEPGSYEINCSSSNDNVQSSGILEQHLKSASSFFQNQNHLHHQHQQQYQCENLEVAVDYSAIKNECEPTNRCESFTSSSLSANASKDSATADARVLLDFANSSKRTGAGVEYESNAVHHATNAAAASTSFFSSNSLFSNAMHKASDQPLDATSPHSGSQDSTSLSLKNRKAALHEQEFIAVEDLISVSCSQSAVVNAAAHIHQQLQPPSQQHTQQQHHQISQSHNSFSDYQFNFFYGNTTAQNAESSSKLAIQQQAHSFSPNMYHQTPDATTTAATVASSSTLDTLEDSTSTPVDSNALQNRFGSVHNTVPQWYQPATLVAHSDFSAALSIDNAAVDGDVGKYLDLDACKREEAASTSVGGLQIVPSSTSSSFAAATDSSLAGGCTTDTLNIRTDEKMPPKGEISEQESNCDIENSWSQPVYGEIPSKFYRTTFPGIFPHDAGWNQEEYFTVQDLSPSGNSAPIIVAANSSKPGKSFEFHLPLENAGTSFANTVVTLSNDDVFPSTSQGMAAKKRKKRHSESGTQRNVAGRSKPTSTITSQQLLQGNNTLANSSQNPYEQSNQTPTSQQRHQKPSTSTAAAAAAARAASTTAAAATASNLPTRVRRKVYVCPHCSMEFRMLRDKNHHMIEIHNYVRQNRRLISATAVVATTADVASVTNEAASFAALNDSQPIYEITNAPSAAANADEYMTDTKHNIKIKMEYDQPTTASALSQPLTGLIDGIAPKVEFNEEKANVLDDNAYVNVTETSASATDDTKPTLLQPPLPLAVTAPTTKLATLYRMLISYNVSTLKQSQNLSESEEKLIESSIFFCYTCRTNFSSVKLYDAHLTEHPAECFTCGKKFQRWKNFSLHLKRHLGWKEFGCNVCDKKFVVRSALVEHTRMHTGHTPLKCKVCGKSFKRYSNLTQHRKRHGRVVVRKKEYVCHCGEVLPSKARFLWHKETHDSKPKCCPHCCDRFVHANSLRRHIRLAHSDKFDYAEPMECPMCKQVFAKSSIKAHMATHSMDTQHDCNICNKSFSTKWNLKIHLWVHANRTAKPFKCEHCPKAFVREVDFKNHMNAHKQIKPYTCEYCGCKFIRKYNYMRHRREHHGNKKFTCDLCKKSFHRHYYLIEHRRIHTGERPFQCTICGKSSTTKTNHNKHLRIHHSRDPFTVET